MNSMIKKNEINEIENLKTNPLINYKFRPEEKNNSILHALVNPKDNFNYSRFYLPRNGSMLLSRDKAKRFFIYIFYKKIYIYYI